MVSTAVVPRSVRGESSAGQKPRGVLVLFVLLVLPSACGDRDRVAVTEPELDRACSSCHTALEHPGRFSILAHETTAGGRPFRCRDCHGERFGAVTSVTCLGCHRADDPGFVAAHAATWGEGCLACHDGRRFSRGDFDHASTGFPLEGGHRPLGCPACHGDARSYEDLSAAPSTCAGCHAADDPHDDAYGDRCGVCHDAGGWSEGEFDHAFDLGSHERADDGSAFACGDCHGPALAPVPSSTCRSCHADLDPGFAADHVGDWGEACLACHDGVRFSGGVFDHAVTGFALVGRHVGVACTGCHVAVVAFEGFDRAPSACHGCHAADDAHDGLFGAGCDGCHDPSGWSGAEHGFDVLHEAPASPDCVTCHPEAPASYVAYTCYGCHRHDADRTRREHLDAGVADFDDDCMRCHPLDG